MNKRNEAKKLLIHYFREAGIFIDQDTTTEIELIVDLIIDAAVEESRQK